MSTPPKHTPEPPPVIPFPNLGKAYSVRTQKPVVSDKTSTHCSPDRLLGTLVDLSALVDAAQLTIRRAREELMKGIPGSGS